MAEEYNAAAASMSPAELDDRTMLFTGCVSPPSPCCAISVSMSPDGDKGSASHFGYLAVGRSPFQGGVKDEAGRRDGCLPPLRLGRKSHQGNRLDVKARIL